MSGEKKHWITSQAHLLVIASVGLAAILTVLVFLEIRTSRNSQIRADFIRKAQIMEAALKDTLNSYCEVLYSIKGLYDSSEKVERREFRIFVQPLFERHSGIQALEWIPLVTQEQRQEFEASARNQGFFEFQITERQRQGKMVPAGERAVYFPVYYIEPYVGNELALGFDLSSNAERRAAIRRSRESGKLTATARLTLVQEQQKQYGVIALLPVYSRKGEPDPSAKGRISLEGFVLGVFRISEMVISALKAFELDTVIYSLYDRTAPPGKQLLWAHHPDSRNKPHTTTGYLQETDSTDWWFSSEFDMGGRNWTINFAPTTGYLRMYDFWSAWAILAGGLLFTGMVGYLLLALFGRSAALAATNVSMRTEIAERLLAETKLRGSEKRYRSLVSNLDTGVVVHASDTRILLANLRAQELLGLTEDQMLGKIDSDPAWKFVREDQTRLPKSDYPVNVVISRGKPLKNFVGGIYHPDSNYTVWVVVNAFPEYDENRRLKQVVVTFWDYTQLKLAKSELARRTNDLARANMKLQKQIVERQLVEKELKKKQQQIAKDLEVAARIQKSLIPNNFPRIGPVRLAWSFEPCERIGGDIFNFQQTGHDYIGFYMLDVCGHGVSSALISAAVSQFLQTNYELADQAIEESRPAVTLNRLERVFPFERFDSFFTIVYLTVNFVNGRLSYSCAGHPPPILRRTDGTIEVLAVHGPVIGTGQDRPFQQEDKQLRHGDKIILYTDGLLDHSNPTGEFFGKHRFYNTLQKYGDQSVQVLVNSVTKTIGDFAGNTKSSDDISLMVIEYI